MIHPDQVLRKQAADVTEFGPELNKLIIEMYRVMKHFDGAGLAAPQVGLSQRLFVFRDYDNGQNERYMVNPVILSSEGEQEDWEGCLSFPGVSVKVTRAEKIKVEFQDSDGEFQTEEFSGFTARAIQHEIEHLEGKTFDRYLSNLKRDVVKRKMTKVKKRVEEKRVQAAQR